MSKDAFFDSFNPISAKEWEEKIKIDLKGADYNETLIWESPEGISVQPFYHADNAINISKLEKSSSAWCICQTINVEDDNGANAKAKEAIEKGAESLRFIIISEKINVEVLLKGINDKKVQIYFEFQCFSKILWESITDFAANSKGDIHLCIDPIGHFGKTGNWFNSINKDLEVNTTINTISVDVSVYQNSGANMVQQLAYALSHANEYLNVFSNKHNIEKVHFTVSVGTNYFFEIAKLRALRLLWKVLSSAYDIEADCCIIAVPTKRNKTLYDYNTNMLRTTTECMSAVLGGANVISNMPYDAIYKEENEFGTRISLNQLLLLKNESYFDKVNNAVDGAYYIEDITQQLTEKALELFKSIEKKGGFIKQLEQGGIQKEIAASALKEQAYFNKGEKVLVGTNKYINEIDKMSDTIELHPFTKANSSETTVEPLLGRRLSESLELERLSNE